MSDKTDKNESLSLYYDLYDSQKQLKIISFSSFPFSITADSCYNDTVRIKKKYQYIQYKIKIFDIDLDNDIQ